MAKILTLSTKDWITGISSSSFLQTGILGEDTKGINPVSNNDDIRGLLAPAGTSTDIAGAAIVDEPIAYTTDSSAGTTTSYILGHEGHLYSQDTLTPTTTPTDHRSGTPITNPANGLETFQSVGASNYLYYWQKTQIGQWDMTGSYATGWTDNWVTGLTDSYVHCTHKFDNQIFYGNGDAISRIYDNAGTTANQADILDFYADYQCVSIADDGYYLIIAITNQTVSGTPSGIAGNKVLFWDRSNSISWNREWNLSGESAIIAVKRVGARVYCVTTESIWLVSFGTPPQKVADLTTNLRLSYASFTSLGSSGHHKVTQYKEGIAWAASDRVGFYGKLAPEAPEAMHCIVDAAADGDFLTITHPNRSYLYMGSDGEYWYTQPGVPASTTAQAHTSFIPLNNTYQISRVEFIFGEETASGDSLQVSLAADKETSATLIETITHAKVDAQTDNKRVYNIYPKSFKCENLQIQMAFNGGAYKVKTINVYGEKVSR